MRVNVSSDQWKVYISTLSQQSTTIHANCPAYLRSCGASPPMPLSETRHRLQQDTAEDVSLTKSIIEGQPRVEHEVYLLELIPPFSLSGPRSIGLVLKGRLDGPLSRIGVYMLHANRDVLGMFFDGIVEECKIV